MSGEQNELRVKHKRIKKLPSWLIDDEVRHFLSCIDVPEHKILFSCMYYLGLRVGEATQLVASDFNIRESYLHVRAEISKTKHERLIPIPKSFIPQISGYLINCKIDAKVFAISTTWAWRLSKLYQKKSGITKRISPHVLRHSYASQVLALTNNLSLVQNLLGHKDIKTTAIYLHLNINVMKKGIEDVFKTQNGL